MDDAESVMATPASTDASERTKTAYRVRFRAVQVHAESRSEEELPFLPFFHPQTAEHNSILDGVI